MKRRTCFREEIRMFLFGAPLLWSPDSSLNMKLINEAYQN